MGYTEHNQSTSYKLWVMTILPRAIWPHYGQPGKENTVHLIEYIKVLIFKDFYNVLIIFSMIFLSYNLKYIISLLWVYTA